MWESHGNPRTHGNVTGGLVARPGCDCGRLPVLSGMSDGSSVAGAESERRSRRRPHLPVLHISSVLLLHGMAQGSSHFSSSSSTWDGSRSHLRVSQAHYFCGIRRVCIILSRCSRLNKRRLRWTTTKWVHAHQVTHHR